jgi:hypothetical protein
MDPDTKPNLPPAPHGARAIVVYDPDTGALPTRRV